VDAKFVSPTWLKRRIIETNHIQPTLNFDFLSEYVTLPNDEALISSIQAQVITHFSNLL
jgi:hypothetical protein